MPEAFSNFLQRLFAPLLLWVQSLFDKGTGRLPPNDTLQQGRYAILKTVGRGGMGAVYLALDTQSQKPVAIKEMSQAKLKPEDLANARQLFEHEARLLQSLNHPNIPKVYNAFQERHRSYIVMEFINGETLQDLLKKARGNTLDTRAVLKYGQQLCDVLDYLHQQPSPVIFRDLKPSNIMVGTDGRVYLIDFGIARFFKPGQQGDTQVFGTPGYIAPEQLANDQSSPYSDIYSLGVTLHYCLTAKNPIYSANPFQFISICPVNPSVPDELDSLIQQMVSLDRQYRPASAAEVKQKLLQIEQQLPTWPTQHTPVNPPPGKTQWMPGGNWPPPAVSPPSPVPPPPQPRQPVVSPVLLSMGQRVRGMLQKTPAVAQKVPAMIQKVPAQKLVIRSLGQVVQVVGSLQHATWYDKIWSRYFIFLFGFSFMAAAGGSYYFLHTGTRSVHLTAFFLTAFLLVITGIASTGQTIREPLARSILFLIEGLLLIALLALQAFSDTQSILQQWAGTITLQQLFIGLMLFGAVVILIEPSERFDWIGHLILIGLAGSCALLQWVFGVQALQQLSFLTPNSYTTINAVITWALVALAVISLLRVRLPFNKADALILLSITLVCGLLQYGYGYSEVQHITAQSADSMASLRSLVTVNVILTALPITLAVIALFSSPRWVQAIAVFGLVVVWAFMQNFLGQGLHITLNTEDLLAIKILDIHTPQQVISDLLLIGSLVLLLRLKADFNWIDHIALFAVAVACATLDKALWDEKAQQLTYYGQPDQTLANQQFTITASQGLGWLLYVLLIGAFIILIVIAFLWLFQLVRPYAIITPKVTRLTALLERVERFILVLLVATSLLLAFFFQNILQVITGWTNDHWHGNGQDLYMLLFVLVLALLLIFGSIILARTFRPSRSLQGSERFTAVLGALVCLLLTWQTQEPTLTTPIQLTGNLLHLSPATLQLLFTGSLLLSLGLAFLWLRRFSRLDESTLLKIVYTIVVVLLFIGLLAPLLTLFALILFAPALVLEMQMERTH